MNLLRRLIPPFLKRSDLRLQADHPRLWSTRLHYHLWFLFLVNVLVFALGLVVSVTPRSFPDPEELWGYMMLPAVVYFAFWVYKVVLFTVERRFGIRHFYAEVGEFLTHLISILLILSIPYTLALTVAWRIDHLVSDHMFVDEVNALNEEAPWFYGTDRYYEDPSQPHSTPYTIEVAMDEATQDAEAIMAQGRRLIDQRSAQGSGTHEFFRSVKEFERRNLVNSGSVDTERPLHSIYQSYIDARNACELSDSAINNADTAAYYDRLIDSIETHFPLLCVQFGPFRPYQGTERLPFLSDSLLEVRYIADQRAHAPPDHQAIQHVLSIGNHYSQFVRMLPADTVLREFEQRKSSTASVTSCAEQIGRINNAKVLGYMFMRPELILYGLLISCFVFTLLISIFKNIYWQPFLIMLAVSALLPILVLIFSLLTEHTVFHMSDEKIMMWSYYWIAISLLVMLFTVPQLKAYRTYSAVMTILANLAVPFIALFTFFILDNEFDIFGKDALMNYISALRSNDPMDVRLPALDAEYDALRDRVLIITQIVLWGGLVLYITVLHPIFRNLYTRLMALPERK